MAVAMQGGQAFWSGRSYAALAREVDERTNLLISRRQRAGVRRIDDEAETVCGNDHRLVLKHHA